MFKRNTEDNSEQSKKKKLKTYQHILRRYKGTERAGREEKKKRQHQWLIEAKQCILMLPQQKLKNDMVRRGGHNKTTKKES